MTKVAPRAKSEIGVRDVEGHQVKLAKCCSPIRGEPIIGYITSGKGITVHSLRCSLITKEILDNQRMVEVFWDETTKGLYKGKFLIKSEDSPGVLAKLTSVIAQLEGNITKAEVNTSADKKAQIKLVLTIRDLKHLENIKKKVLGIKEILSVERI